MSGSHVRTPNGLVCDDEGKPIRFESAADAQAYIAKVHRENRSGYPPPQMWTVPADDDADWRRLKVKTDDPRGWQNLVIFLAGCVGASLGFLLCSVNQWTDGISLWVIPMLGLVVPTAVLYKLFEEINYRRSIRKPSRQENA